MNSTPEATVSLLVGGSERLHDVAGAEGGGGGRRSSGRSSVKSPIQKLLARMTHIMSPLTTDQYQDYDRDEYPQQQSIEDIILSPGQRNSFHQFLRSTELSQPFLKSFQFLCLCRELREWSGRPGHSRSRVKVLRKYIYQTFLQEGAPQQLDLSAETRKAAERSRAFEEVYRRVGSNLVQQGVVRAYAESHYHQSVWEEEEWSLFRSLSLGTSSTRGARFGGSQASSASSTSSYSSYRNTMIGSGSSDVSSLVSEIHSIASSKSGSSKSSSGSNASVAFDKFYSHKHAPRKSRSNPNPRNVIIIPEKLMEELVPRLNVIELEQKLRLQNFGSLDCGPPGADTPAVLRTRGTEEQVPPAPPPPPDRPELEGEGSLSKEDDAMSCEEWENRSETSPEVQIAYTYSSDAMCYGKVLPGPTVTLRQFKEVVSWGGCDATTRYFFKRQIPGLGEVHAEVADDSAVLPFWSTNTIVGRIERRPD